MPATRRRLAAAVLALIPVPAFSASLVPHQAVYELSLADGSEEFQGIDGRIAMQLTLDECHTYDLDYRFVARFQEEAEVTLTDQQTLSRESRDGKDFEFETKTFVDGTEQSVVSGQARNEAGGTQVSLETPVSRSFDLPLSQFPLNHTNALIAKARAGERIVEMRLFDGGDDSEKLLTTTAIITPVDAPEGEDASEEIAERLVGLRAWRIDESYFNSDSDADGAPVFRTRYTLYENGVSDTIFMDFGDYALEGRLGRLEYYDAAVCD